MKQLLKSFLQRLVYKLIKVKIPVGVSDMEAFIKKILDLYKLPDLPSYHHAVASMIMHMGQTDYKISVPTVVASIKAAQSKQVAFEVIQRVKEKEAAAAKAEEAKAAANVEEAQS